MLNEMIKSKNQYFGYRNEVGSDEEYAKTHAMLKKLLGKDDTMIRNYLDSTSGRHLAGNEDDTEYIKKDFKKFMKKYDPSFFKEGVEVDGRTKAFRATMKRIEAYKVKKKSIKTEETEYQKFFKSALKKFNVSSPDELEGEKEKEFYDYVDANWKAKDESVIDKVNKIVNEKRKERMEKIMQECDEPQSGNDKKLVKFHKDNTKKISE